MREVEYQARRDPQPEKPPVRKEDANALKDELKFNSFFNVRETCPHQPKHAPVAYSWLGMSRGTKNAGGSGRHETLKWMLTAPNVAAADRIKAMIVLFVAYDEIPAQMQGLLPVPQEPVKAQAEVSAKFKVKNQAWAEERFMGHAYSSLARAPKRGGKGARWQLLENALNNPANLLEDQLARLKRCYDEASVGNF